MLVNEACNTQESGTKNLGKREQCIEGAVKTAYLAKESFSFADIEAAKSKANHLTAIQNKDLVPIPLIDGIEANNTEATYYNGRFEDFETKAAVHGSNYRINLAICTYAALKTYANSEYTRFIQITTKNEMTVDIQDDGSVKGRKLTSMIVGPRMEATDSDPAYTNLLLKYAEDTYSILKPSGFELTDIEGIVDVSLEIVSASATSIKFKAKDDCANAVYKVFEDGDFVVKDTDGAAQTVSFVAPDADGVYELTGTAFATDYTVELDGVVIKVNDLYETPTPAKITVS